MEVVFEICRDIESSKVVGKVVHAIRRNVYTCKLKIWRLIWCSSHLIFDNLVFDPYLSNIWYLILLFGTCFFFFSSLKFSFLKFLASLDESSCHRNVSRIKKDKMAENLREYRRGTLGKHLSPNILTSFSPLSLSLSLFVNSLPVPRDGFVPFLARIRGH